MGDCLSSKTSFPVRDVNADFPGQCCRLIIFGRSKFVAVQEAATGSSCYLIEITRQNVLSESQDVPDAIG